MRIGGSAAALRPAAHPDAANRTRAGTAPAPGGAIAARVADAAGAAAAAAGGRHARATAHAAARGDSATPPTEQADPNASLVTFSTRMDGDSAVPPTRSAGTGELDALYDTRSHLLRWKAKWSGLSAPITAVQFHAPGEIGQTAPPTMVWPGPFGPTYEGRATLTNQQATDLLSGRWYVNVYTANYPAGEIRGQLREVR